MLPSNKGDVISRKGKLTSYISTMTVYQRQFQSMEFALLNHKIACLQRNLILANSVIHDVIYCRTEDEKRQEGKKKHGHDSKCSCFNCLFFYAFLHFKANYFLKSCLHTTLKASILNPFLKLTAIFATFSQSVIHLKLLQSQQIACHLTHKTQQGFPL